MIYAHLGMAYYKKGDLTLAKDAFQQALRLSPEFPGVDDVKQALWEIEVSSK
jgi:cytochrome c-type biogenesis protein CcmH/NrfG